MDCHDHRNDSLIPFWRWPLTRQAVKWTLLMVHSRSECYG